MNRPNWDELRRQYRERIRQRIKSEKKKKYSNVKTEIHGRTFDSKGEAGLFVELQNREKAGEIKDLRCQESVYLTDAEIRYIPDFSFVNVSTGEKEFWEFKGFETAEWRLKKKLWRYYGPGKLVIRYQNGTEEAIIP